MSNGHTTAGAKPAVMRSTEELDCQRAEHDRLHERDPVAFAVLKESSLVEARYQGEDQSPTELPLQTRKRANEGKPENSQFVQENIEFPQNRQSEDETITDTAAMIKVSLQPVPNLPHLPASTRRLSSDGAGNDQVNLVATTADGTLVLYYNRDKSELMIGATSIRDPNAIFTAKQNPDTGAFQFQHPDGIVGVNTADRKFGLYPYSQPNPSDIITEFLFSGNASSLSNQVSYEYAIQMFVWNAVVNADKNTGMVVILSKAEAERKEDGVYVFGIQPL